MRTNFLRKERMVRKADPTRLSCENLRQFSPWETVEATVQTGFQLRNVDTSGSVGVKPSTDVSEVSKMKSPAHSGAQSVPYRKGLLGETARRYDHALLDALETHRSNNLSSDRDSDFPVFGIALDLDNELPPLAVEADNVCSAITGLLRQSGFTIIQRNK